LWLCIRSDQWPLSDGIALAKRFRHFGKSFCELFAKPLEGCMDLEEQFYLFIYLFNFNPEKLQVKGGISSLLDLFFLLKERRKKWKENNTFYQTFVVL
jgi:hypothetical protein